MILFPGRGEFHFKPTMMTKFLDENVLLHSKTAQQLYHEFAKDMPIIDYHNHLPPDEIAADKNFENITQVWLNGDHYKWRAMRTNGFGNVPAKTIKNSKSQKWFIRATPIMDILNAACLM
jgi:glucuronate isomerase